jgi:two-component system sensor histidine kinase UhpB
LLPSYGDSIDLTVYRCVQESLTNALRHANATHIAIALDETGGDGAVHVTVRDDGCGIASNAPPGRGLRGMQERVQALGGSFVIDGAHGDGTRVQVLLPTRPADGASS